MVTAIAGRQVRTTVRRKELEALRHLVRSATTGRCATVELIGDPGSGKTALLTELASEARREGVAVLRGLCAEPTQERAPFWPFVEALGGLETPGVFGRGGPTGPLPVAASLLRSLTQPPQDPDALAPAGHGLTRRCQYFAEIRRMLANCAAAAPRGLLLVLDDFHWADSCSVRLLETLTRRPVGGLAVVVAHRPRQAPPGLRVVLQHGVELGTVDEVSLAPLTLAQCADLLRTPPDAAGLRQLYERSGGNALYLTVLAAAGGPSDDPTHVGVRRGFENRLLAECALLNADVLIAAHAAAVLGETFDVDSVAAVAQLSQDETCRALGILRSRDLVRAVPGTGALAFRHALLRDFLYAEADSCWRAAAHRRALSHLSELGAPPMDRAPHAVLSGALASPMDEAVLTAAVKEALPVGRTALAAQWTMYALRLHRVGRLRGLAPDSAQPGCELWLPVVRALAAKGDVTRLRALVREVLAVLADQPDAVRVSAVASLARVQAALGLPEEAHALITSTLSALRGGGESEAVLHVQSQLVWVLAGQLPPRADVEVLARHTVRATPVTAAGALVLRGLSAVFAGDLCAAETALDEGAQVLDGLEPEGPDGDALTGYLLVLACAESAMGWYGPAQAHVERALAEARLRGDLPLLPALLNVLAYVDYQAGQMSEALEAAQEARAAALSAGRDHLVALADAVTAAAWAWLGDKAPAGARGAIPEVATGDVPRASVIALLHAEAALAAGDGATALALLLPGREARRVPEPPSILAVPGVRTAGRRISGHRQQRAGVGGPCGVRRRHAQRGGAARPRPARPRACAARPLAPGGGDALL
ncbi:AAA family ATPase [Streptomyces sp. 2A115]|uniref:AAA family ATPase n=1 Tax=Streptomyces sp. 2A115 TaxID=3457439 RepID=UPI003FD0700D